MKKKKNEWNIIGEGSHSRNEKQLKGENPKNNEIVIGFDGLLEKEVEVVYMFHSNRFFDLDCSSIYTWNRMHKWKRKN